MMQQALGEQWQQLPEALKNHYREDNRGNNYANGHMDIQYPWFMQWILNIFYFFGILLNRKGQMVKTEVTRTTKNGHQQWHRIITFADGNIKKFNSIVVFDPQSGCFIEFVNALLGLRMKPIVNNGVLRYESYGYILKIKQFSLRIPEWLALGHVTIMETQKSVDNDFCFNMDFRLKHWLFGEIFCYRGQFITQKIN